MEDVKEYFLDRSIEKEFTISKDGFKMAVNMDWLALVESADLQLAFCGLTAIDWKLLEKTTDYQDHFWSQHPVVRYFWTYARSLDNTRSRRLFKLWTSSEVCPLTLPRLHIMF